MPNDNNGLQSGDNSLNVGVGDFRGANVNIGGNGRSTFTPEQIKIQRHLVFGGRSVKSDGLNVFGVVTGVASLAGLYFTLFQAFSEPKYSSWSTVLMFMFAIATFSVVIAGVLRKRKFEYFLFRKYYIEADKRYRLHLSSFTATCPWCQSKMHLRNIGPKDGPRYDRFICERNSRQHTIDLDPTILPEIDE